MTQLINKCPESQQLQSYLDCGLTKPECKRLEEHVRQCQRCTEELVSFQLIFEDLAMKLSPDASDRPKPEEIGRLLQVIKRAKPCKKSVNTEKIIKWVFPWNLLAGAALTILFFITILSIGPGTSPKNLTTKPEKTDQNCTFTIQGPKETGLVKRHLNGEIPSREGFIESGYTYEVLLKGLATIHFSENLIECHEKAIFVMRSSGLNLLHGKARFSIHPGKSSFAVTTPDGVVRCLGTRFTVETTPQGTFVSLEDGKIELTAGESKVIQSEPGALYKMSSGKVQKRSLLPTNTTPDNRTHYQSSEKEPALVTPNGGSFETSY